MYKTFTTDLFAFFFVVQIVFQKDSENKCNMQKDLLLLIK